MIFLNLPDSPGLREEAARVRRALPRAFATLLTAGTLAACGASFVGPATQGAYEPVDCRDGTFCPDPAYPQCPPFVPPGMPRPPCEAAGQDFTVPPQSKRPSLEGP